MSCSRGKANPTAATRIKLFADSAGYCQNPGCTQQLFHDTSNGESIHFAEMAHMFAASDKGPRADARLSEEERGAYDNLILLCANCHRIIDKAPDDYPDALIFQWKSNRAEQLVGLFGAARQKTREDVLTLIEPLMSASAACLQVYGPGSEARFDPESDGPEIWRRKMLGVIIPNNKKILAVLDKNRTHMVPKERATLEGFRQHTEDLIARHLEGVTGGRMYPREMNEMMF